MTKKTRPLNRQRIGVCPAGELDDKVDLARKQMGTLFFSKFKKKKTEEVAGKPVRVVP